MSTCTGRALHGQYGSGRQVNGPAQLHSFAHPALVAQWIEHLTTDQKVGGSNPSERAENTHVTDGLPACVTPRAKAARTSLALPAAADATCRVAIGSGNPRNWIGPEENDARKHLQAGRDLDRLGVPGPGSRHRPQALQAVQRVRDQAGCRRRADRAAATAPPGRVHRRRRDDTGRVPRALAHRGGADGATDDGSVVPQHG
jgi:hypothetical protein